MLQVVGGFGVMLHERASGVPVPAAAMNQAAKMVVDFYRLEVSSAPKAKAKSVRREIDPYAGLRLTQPDKPLVGQGAPARPAEQGEYKRERLLAWPLALLVALIVVISVVNLTTRKDIDPRIGPVAARGGVEVVGAPSVASVGKLSEPVPVAPPSPKWAPSFDCAKASSRQELLICDDQELSALDVKLATTYRAHIKASDNPSAVKGAQLRWLDQERGRCDNHLCLRYQYLDRIAALERKP